MRNESVYAKVRVFCHFTPRQTQVTWYAMNGWAETRRHSQYRTKTCSPLNRK